VAREYDFAVVSRSHPSNVLYGVPNRAELRKPFLSIVPNQLLLPNAPAAPIPGQLVVAQRVGSAIVIQRVVPLTELSGAGFWELEVAHKGVPLVAAFQLSQRRNLLLSIGVEALLLVAIVFLVVGARRMQRLGDQKIQFVAAVSHELRTPVSAIAMLSRNQADGLVSGAERVEQYGELIHQQSRRLNEIVEQTLQYAGIHSDPRRTVMNEVDLCSLISEGVEAWREELSRGGFAVETALIRWSAA
jgi:signal transduction histidine kinase